MSWDFDTDLFGLKYELIAFLAAREIVWFEHFSTVDADAGNGELAVRLLCDYGLVEDAACEFAQRNGFARVFYSTESGTVFLRRR